MHDASRREIAKSAAHAKSVEVCPRLVLKVCVGYVKVANAI